MARKPRNLTFCLSLSTYCVFFMFLLCVATPGYAQQEKKKLTDTEYTLCKSKIERAHQGFYRLPYQQEYVRDVIMPAIRSERAAVAPHFPQRVSGTSSDELFKSWIEEYPAEYEAYLQFLRKQHEKWRLAASANH